MEKMKRIAFRGSQLYITIYTLMISSILFYQEKLMITD